ncbi:MAG: 23S rRNA (pseudouridine(1915)-N(3))-methyltransferase RlmH [Bacteroidaceae bacterium]|nr:23S rRNA (pseudouridine(1915)-N(3))-methyltransferase RlmH [Bacteroidaceae bacterium]
MKISLTVVGKTTDRHFIAGIDEYVQRISHYVPFSIDVIPELKGTKNLSEKEQKEREGELILKSFQTGDYIVLLDEHGRERRSIEFAQWMQKRMAAGPKRLVFVVGGPYGFSPAVYAAAQEKVSLSQMTLSHQMIRLLFTEQIYRAMTILNGEPYHHE